MNLVLNSSYLGISNGAEIRILDDGDIEYNNATYHAPKLKIKFNDDEINSFYSNDQLVEFAVHVFKKLYKCGKVIELDSNNSDINIFKVIGGSSRHEGDKIYIHNGPNPLEFVHEIIHALLGANDLGDASHINEMNQNLGPLSTSFCASLNVFSEGVPGYLFDLNTHLQIHGINSSLLDIRPFHYLFPVYANDIISRSSVYPEVKNFCTELFNRESKNKDEINTELATLLLMLFFARINHDQDSTNKSTYNSPITYQGYNMSMVDQEEKTEIKKEKYRVTKNSQQRKIYEESKLLKDFLVAKFKDEYRLYLEFPKFNIKHSFTEEAFIIKNIEFIESRIKKNKAEFQKLNLKEKIGFYNQFLEKAKKYLHTINKF